MDLLKAIRELYDEKRRIEQVIAHLEALSVQRVGAPTEVPVAPRRRGRKGMTEDEREEVSRRMKEYWANRRKTRVKGSKGANSPAAEKGSSA